MKNFNSTPKTREELQSCPKEELINLCLGMQENHKQFIDLIFKSSMEDFEQLKEFYKLINGEDK